MKKILITGAKGFLGSNLSNHFNNLGYETFGVGHRSPSSKKEKELSMKYWIDGDITKKSILELDNKYDVIIHCGGSGSVGYSMNHVKDDFKKTVDSTKEVLEFMREYNPSAHLIYPSSPAVQGEHPDQPIKEEYVGEPTSSSTTSIHFESAAKPNILFTKLLPNSEYNHEVLMIIEFLSLYFKIFFSPSSFVFPYLLMGLTLSVSLYGEFRYPSKT